MLVFWSDTQIDLQLTIGDVQFAIYRDRKLSTYQKDAEKQDEKHLFRFNPIVYRKLQIVYRKSFLTDKLTRP